MANIIAIGASAGGDVLDDARRSLGYGRYRSCLAALEEKLAGLADHRGDRLTAESFREVAQDRQHQASIIRALLLSKNKSGEIIAP